MWSSHEHMVNIWGTLLYNCKMNDEVAVPQVVLSPKLILDLDTDSIKINNLRWYIFDVQVISTHKNGIEIKTPKFIFLKSCSD